MAAAYGRLIDFLPPVSDAASYTLTAEAAASVGERVVVGFSYFGTEPVSSVSDSEGNTWVLDEGGADGISLHVYSCEVENPIGIGDTITIAFANTVSWFNAAAVALTGVGTKESSHDYRDDDSYATTATALTADTGVLLSFAGLRDGTDRAHTPGASLTEVGEGKGGNINFAVQYRNLVAAGSYNASGTWVASDGLAGRAAHIIYPESGGGSPPANTVAPVASGNPQRTETLSVSDGTWSGSPAPTFTYQWQRDNSGGGSYSNIGGATSDEYQATATDVGCNVRCVVTGTNSEGSATANSNALKIGDKYVAPDGAATENRVNVCGSAVVNYDVPLAPGAGTGSGNLSSPGMTGMRF